MKRIVVAAALLLFAGSALAEDAKALFQQKCAVCHGKGGKGDTPMGQKLGIADLTQTKMKHEQIEKVISDGKGKMTGYKGKLSDAQISELAKFIEGGLK
jgi:cytochrome c6